MSSTKSQGHPCLPQKLLNELNNDAILTAKSSAIYTESYQQFRMKALSTLRCETAVIQQSSIPLRPTMNPRIFRKIDLFVEGQCRTWLHLAARNADVPLAYESIRIGTAVDYKDKDGITALLLACMMLRYTKAIQDLTKPSSSPPRQIEALSDKLLKEIERRRRIATLFVEQHADVNVSVDGETPLSVAAEAACWPLVELLIRHGAKVPTAGQPLYPALQSAAQRSKFRSLIRTTKRASSRPSRPCPCWSGKLLVDCHAAESIPYPADYMCRCGRNRTYGKCCAKREFKIVETWSEKDSWVMPVTQRCLELPGDDTFRAGWERTLDVVAQLAQAGGYDVPAMRRRVLEAWQEVLENLPKEIVDPAFLYAAKSVDFLPRAWGGQLSKVENKKRMDEWNAAVDAYVKSGVDRRPVWNIEFNSKMGLNGGRLHKHCEEPTCRNAEGRDVERMKCCGSCKLIVYCSQACQIKDWQRHKAECKAKLHKEQQLPVQELFEEMMRLQTIETPDGDYSADIANILNLDGVRGKSSR